MACDRAYAAREFTTGAKRDTEEGKLRFHAALSPYALEAWVDYCRRHNNQVHRCEENWKRGMPLESFISSHFRHAHHWWKMHDTTLGNGDLTEGERRELIEALCAVLFNAHGYLHELTKPGERQMLNEHTNPTD